MSKKNQAKSQRKQRECIAHRTERLEHWLDRLIDGEVTPEEVTIRANKLKQVKGK